MGAVVWVRVVDLALCVSGEGGLAAGWEGGLANDSASTKDEGGCGPASACGRGNRGSDMARRRWLWVGGVVFPQTVSPFRAGSLF